MAKYCIYTDESWLTPDETHMMIGMLFVPMEIHAIVHNKLKLIFGKAKGWARKSRNNFLLSLIKKNDLSTIQKLLREDKNAFEMKFSNINNINLQLYKDFIDVVATPWVKFCTFVIDKKNGAWDYSLWQLFVNRYSLGLSTNISRLFNDGDSFFIMCDELSTPKHAEMLFEDELKCRIEYAIKQKWAIRDITWITTISSHASLFCQVCDLLLWTVMCRMREKQWLSIKAKKIEFTDHINTLIGEDIDFCSNSTVNTPLYFSIWHYIKK